MPARDFVHGAVIAALEKDGWTITDDPLRLEFAGERLFVDIGAERLIAAEKGKEKIAVEAKSFLGSSPLSDFHLALGQYLHYRMALKAIEPERKLFLAVPADVYEEYLSLEFGQLSIREHQLRLFTVNLQEEVILQWQT